ncbi:glycoside hydrolase family 88/105 protein [Sphingobacterium chungjuense]|uniref:glycoside hydrolase family 88/105 protein n=1 Tax=Sphingobacterium chungjuense TaxID=2675553 RepID=UPI00140A3887|nr:glycoside hydrolase family 88 protein [Sphingobacterium chungjuense]
MNWIKHIGIALIILYLTGCTSKKYAIDAIDKQDVLASIRSVNTYWQQNNKPQNWAFWDEAAYHTGNMSAYEVTKDSAFLEYSLIWAKSNDWKGAKSDKKEDWKYSYGESDDYVLFGDWQICFQTYIDLYHLDKDEQRIHRAMEVMKYQMSTPADDYWWWADGLYMVMPVMTKLYQVTNNSLYLEKLYTYFRYADSLMFDQEAHLYYRDGKYLYPKHKSANGKRDFWARGDGWVLAGLAKVLADLPKEYEHRPFFEQRFTQLAAAVAAVQQPEGYWTRSLLDPEHAPGPETSGTAFFTYGLLWGVNNGYLNAADYLPVIDRSWRYLQDVAVQADGSVGYVQPIGEKAIPGQVVDQNSTTNFGVGAYLLAATELYKYLDK